MVVGCGNTPSLTRSDRHGGALSRGHSRERHVELHNIEPNHDTISEKDSPSTIQANTTPHEKSPNQHINADSVTSTLPCVSSVHLCVDLVFVCWATCFVHVVEGIRSRHNRPSMTWKSPTWVTAQLENRRLTSRWSGEGASCKKIGESLNAATLVRFKQILMNTMQSDPDMTRHLAFLVESGKLVSGTRKNTGDSRFTPKQHQHPTARWSCSNI